MKSSILKAGAVALFSVTSLSACSTAQVVDNTGEAITFIGTTAVRGVVGAGRLAVRGTRAGIGRLQEAQDGRPAGTLVCLNNAGDVYATATEENGETVCPPVPA